MKVDKTNSLSISDLSDNQLNSLNNIRDSDQKSMVVGSLDEVKNVSVKNIFPDAEPKSDKTDELRLNLSRADVYKFARNAWNDVYWLASIVILMSFLSCLLIHHYELRLLGLGSRMRIACCSIIYRKVIIKYSLL